MNRSQTIRDSEKRAAFHISAADTGTKNKYGFMFGLVDQAFKTGKQM